MNEAVAEYMEGMIGELLSGTWGVPPEYKVLYNSWFERHAPALDMLIKAAGDVAEEEEGEAEEEKAEPKKVEKGVEKPAKKPEGAGAGKPKETLEEINKK